MYSNNNDAEARIQRYNEGLVMSRAKLDPRRDETSYQTHIPLSLGKPSLRVRLEAYYSLIDPSRLEDKATWRKNVDEIYKKVRFGC